MAKYVKCLNTLFFITARGSKFYTFYISIILFMFKFIKKLLLIMHNIFVIYSIDHYNAEFFK